MRTAAGDVVSQPRLATVPYAILSFSTPNTSPGELDPEDMRHVTTRSGVQVWVIPGGRGMCLATIRPQPHEPAHLPGSGAADVCSANLAQSESDGVGLSSGEPGGVQTLYEIVPIGDEGLFMDFDAELTELLSQA